MLGLKFHSRLCRSAPTSVIFKFVNDTSDAPVTLTKTWDPTGTVIVMVRTVLLSAEASIENTLSAELLPEKLIELVPAPVTVPVLASADQVADSLSIKLSSVAK